MKSPDDEYSDGLCAEIESLRIKVAAGEWSAVPEWISVEKQLPVLHKGYSADCLVITNFGNRLISRYDSYSKSWSLYQCEDHSVTHWMPLPAAPKRD